MFPLKVVKLTTISGLYTYNTRTIICFRKKLLYIYVFFSVFIIVY